VKKQITMRRTWEYPLEDIWELWTTKEGIESWWGPDGFRTTVHRLDLKPGGALEYSFTAVGAEQIAFLEKAGQPIVSTVRGKYIAVQPMTLLAWNNLTDFIQGVEPYEVETRVELKQTRQGVEMTLKFDVMHDERWTQLAQAGWESELRKLAAQLEIRRKKS
jgi:uncharacterized protein YndB with AHSA1/START domain